MSQVSPPLRIALIASVAFLAVWLLFLRPQPAEVASTPDPPAATADGSSVAGDAVADANLSAADADAQAAAAADGTAVTAPTTPAPTTTEAATGVAVAPDATAAAGRPAEADAQALAQLPRDVARAVRRDQVIALLFWNSRAAEDRKVRRALRTANVHGDKVFVKTASVRDISRYAPITRGADVQQSPTVVVVDADLRAESLVGYVARTTIRQALSDALRATR